MKKLAYVLPFVAILAAPGAFAATRHDAAQAILKAVQANDQARSVGYEWRDTYKKLLGPAKQAYRKGDYDKAVRLADAAGQHAELGMAQYQANLNAGPRF
ncbi:MAG: hypothetical protein P8090_15135 [Gammaproteobacteria bacterium]